MLVDCNSGKISCEALMPLLKDKIVEKHNKRNGKGKKEDFLKQSISFGLLLEMFVYFWEGERAFI